MPRDLTTGVMVYDRAVQWTTLHPAKGGSEGGGTREVSLEFAGRENVSVFSPPTDDVHLVPGEIREKCGRIEGWVSAGIPASRVLMRVANLPHAAPEELQGMAELQVDKFSPFPAENLSVSYEVLAVKDGTVRVLIAAIQNEVAESLRGVFRPSGTLIRRIDADLLAWWRLLADAGMFKTPSRQLFLLLSRNQAYLFAVEDGTPLLFRALGPLGSLPAEEFVAETAREIGYTLTAIEVEYGPAQPTPVAFWHDAETPENLLQGLREECGLEVEPHRLDILPPLSEGLARRAAAGEAHTLDLAPAAWRAAESQAVIRKKFLTAGLAFAAAWLIAVGGFIATFQIQRLQLSSLKGRFNTLENKAGEIRRIMGQVRFLDQYSDRKRSALQCLLEITKAKPDGITLTSCLYKKGKNVTISGEAIAVDLVYQFKQTLDVLQISKNVRFFAAVTLDGPNRDPRSGKETFRIVATMPGGAP